MGYRTFKKDGGIMHYANKWSFHWHSLGVDWCRICLDRQVSDLARKWRF